VINRFELKFLLPPERRAEVETALVSRLDIDPNGGGSYEVSSLYFDSPDWRWLLEKLDGVDPRQKVRVRWYGGKLSQASQGFLEIKHRRERRVLKERVICTKELLPNLLSVGLREALALEGPDPDGLVPRVALLASRLELRPATVIHYQRRAFQAPDERRLRITFDEDVRAWSSHDLDLEGLGHPVLPPGWTVLEVKFDQRIPAWVGQALRTLQLRLQPFSKYAEGVLALRGLSSHALPPALASLRSQEQ